MSATRRAARIAAASLLALAAGLALAGCRTEIVAAPAANAQLNTVTATGNGKASAAPDQATVSFGVTRQASNAKTALDQASVAAAQVASAVKKAGVADKDIQTADVNVYPQYSTPSASGKSTISGYQASITVSVIARDLSKLGDLITAANQAGADTVNGPSFGLADDSPAQDQATTKAVADARRSAEAMAKAAGRSLGAVVSMSSSNVSNVPLPMRSAAAADSAQASVPIQPGQLQVTSEVTVVFQLK
jgi:uncharacterized protein